MTDAGTVDDDALAGWDPRRRAALAEVWAAFAAAGGGKVSLSEELVAERRTEAGAEDHWAKPG